MKKFTTVKEGKHSEDQNIAAFVEKHIKRKPSYTGKTGGEEKLLVGSKTGTGIYKAFERVIVASKR